MEKMLSTIKGNQYLLSLRSWKRIVFLRLDDATDVCKTKPLARDGACASLDFKINKEYKCMDPVLDNVLISKAMILLPLCHVLMDKGKKYTLISCTSTEISVSNPRSTCRDASKSSVIPILA